MEVLSELFWVSVLIGGPALIAVIWEKRSHRRKDDLIFATVEEYRNEFD